MSQLVGNGIQMSRVWAMPSHETFTIAPVRKLIERHISAGGEWIDPFCRDSIFKARCTLTNDLNPKFAGTHNMDALDFLKSLPAGAFDGVLFDPPFSPRQAKEEYSGFGMAEMLDTSRAFYSKRKREAARVLKVGGIAICCAWNSLGLGKKNGMQIEEVLLINHGDQNDTIVTVCRKISAELDFEEIEAAA